MDLDGRVITLNKRYTAVKEAGTRIQAMVAVRAPGAARLNPRDLFYNGRPPHTRPVKLVSCSVSPCPGLWVRPEPPALHKRGADKRHPPTRSPKLVSLG